MGNAIVPDPYRSPDLEEEGTQNLTSLKTKADVSRYLAQTSDLVALMTFEHQLRMSNLLVRITRQARQVEQSANAELTDGLRACKRPNLICRATGKRLARSNTHCFQVPSRSCAAMPGSDVGSRHT